MIRRINKLRGYGIFRDYAGTHTHEFDRLNLIYGWNGSGKSTLSTLFAALEKKALLPRFEDAEVGIALEGGKVLTEKTLATNNVNIRTFNQDFVNENIDWNNRIKGILLVDRKKIDEKARLEALSVKQRDEKAKLGEKRAAQERVQSERDRFLTTAARHVKENMQAINTKDAHYLNYDRRKLNALLSERASRLRNVAPMDDEGLQRLTQAARPIMLDRVIVPTITCEGDAFAARHARLQSLLSTSAVNTAIARLTANDDIRHWVQAGLRVHKDHESAACEFCGEALKPGTIQRIEGHFSRAYEQLQADLSSEKVLVASVALATGVWPDAGLLYEELRDEYGPARERAGVAIGAMNAWVDGWASELVRKIENPALTTGLVEPLPKALLDEARTAIQLVTDLLGRHNTKTDNFSGELKVAQVELEEELARRELADFPWFDSLATSETLRAEVDALSDTTQARQQEMNRIEESLSNEGLGAAAFNDSLHRFLGRSELTLAFNAAAGGYEIHRAGAPGHDVNLSEGEKTAIAFVYFITKLAENDNNIKDTIVVVDDPVSSFDSNHLFHAYSYLRTRCGNAKQLFVLTHNFTFFRMVREWLAGINRNRKNRKETQPPAAYFYTIESGGNPRSSTILDAGKSLVEYNSEYHFIYARLAAYRGLERLDRDQAFMAANLARKLMEAFFGFKFPQHRSDLAALLEAGQAKCTETTAEVREKVYRFVNRYSHGPGIEVDEDAVENMMGESGQVVGDIFTWIREVDSDHVEQMELVVAEEAQ